MLRRMLLTSMGNRLRDMVMDLAVDIQYLLRLMIERRDVGIGFA